MLFTYLHAKTVSWNCPFNNVAGIQHDGLQQSRNFFVHHLDEHTLTLSVENHFPQLSTMFSLTPHCNETKNFRIWNTIWASPNYMCIWMQIFRNSGAKHYTYRSTNCKEFRHIIERSTVLSTTEYTSQNIIDGQINSFTKCKKFVL